MICAHREDLMYPSGATFPLCVQIS